MSIAHKQKRVFYTAEHHFVCEAESLVLAFGSFDAGHANVAAEGQDRFRRKTRTDFVQRPAAESAKIKINAKKLV